MNDPEPFDDEAVASLDRKYTSFPDFDEWLRFPLDDILWDETVEIVEDARRQLSIIELERVREKVFRAAAFDTGAIEGLYPTDRGFTITVAEQATMWQQGVEERGPITRELFEAQLKAYHLALNIATDTMPVTEAWIRVLHEVVTEPQTTYTVYTSAGPQEQPLPKGAYKRYPNHVIGADEKEHAYAPVNETPHEMARLVATLGTEAFQAAHPIHQVSYSHYALAVIHPFADGNGRVARALASVWLLRALSLPLVIFNDQKGEYLRDLSDADDGDFSKFIDFIADCATGSATLAIDMLRRDEIADPQTAVQSLRTLLTFQHGVGHSQMDQFAASLLVMLNEQLNSAASGLGLPDEISFFTQILPRDSTAEPAISGFRHQSKGQQHKIVMVFNSTAPATAHVEKHFWAYISTNRSEAFPLILGTDRNGLIRFRLSEVRHGISGSARQRIIGLAEQIIGESLSTLERQAAESLRKAGYDIK